MFWWVILLTDVDECTVSSSSPCENGATCRNIDGWFECDCAKGWRGLNCSTGIIKGKKEKQVQVVVLSV